MNRSRKIISIFLLSVALAMGLFAFFNSVSAQPIQPGLEFASTTGLSSTDIRVTIARIIRTALGLLGIVAVALMLYAGFTWMTAGGNEEKIGQAKKILINAGIGLVIIFSAYAIVSFIMNRLIEATTGGIIPHCSDGIKNEGETGVDCGGACDSCGGPNPNLPGADSFYVYDLPANGQLCIRNVHPVITFNRALDISTLKDADGNYLVTIEKVTGADTSVAASGTWAYGERESIIAFTPSGACPSGVSDCLDESATYTIKFRNLNDIKSRSGGPSDPPLPLIGCRDALGRNIGGLATCNRVEFITGTGVDRLAPMIRFDAPALNSAFDIGSLVQVSVSFEDDNGVQNISLFNQNNLIGGKAFASCVASGTVEINWSTNGLSPGPRILSAFAYDWAALSGSSTRSVILNPPAPVPTSFYADSLPEGGQVCIRNVHPSISFNKPVDISTLKDFNGNYRITVEKQGGAVAEGVWNYGAEESIIAFTASGTCPSGVNDCLEENATYTIRFVSINSIRSKSTGENDPSLPLIGCRDTNGNIGGQAACNRVLFKTGGGVDRQPPTVSFNTPAEGSPFQIGATVPVNLSFGDDFGVQNVSLFYGHHYIGSKSFPNCVRNGTVDITWPTDGYATGTKLLRAISQDWSAETNWSERSFMLLPHHCYSGARDADEEQADCGGSECLRCPNRPCTDDTECASGNCQNGICVPPPPSDHCSNGVPDADEEQTDCGGNDCLRCPRSPCTEDSQCAGGACRNGVCVNLPMIESFSPNAGATGTTYVTISGFDFGTTSGHVYFAKIENPNRDNVGDWTEADIVDCGAAGNFNNWTNGQIVVRVPANAVTGPIKVVTAENLVDATNDARGNNNPAEFTVNNIRHPRLCRIVPASGVPNAVVELDGENFGEFGNVFFDGFDAGVRPDDWQNTFITTRVPPSASPGAVPVKVTVNGVESNSLRFDITEGVLETAPIIYSITPDRGARGEYLTITGRNFGSNLGRLWFKKTAAGASLPSELAFAFPVECTGALWSTTTIIAKFPSSTDATPGQYFVQVDTDAGTSAISQSAIFLATEGAPRPGICKMIPNNGPIPFPAESSIRIVGEYFDAGDQQPQVYFWKNDASTSTIDGRARATVVSRIAPEPGTSGESILVRPGDGSQDGDVVLYRPADRIMSNPLRFTVSNCLRQNNCAATEHCCRNGSCAARCEGERVTSGYIWRFNTRTIPPTPKVVENCTMVQAADGTWTLPVPPASTPLSPSPDYELWGDDSRSACLTSLVTVEFNMAMSSTPALLNSNNVYIRTCSNVNQNNCENASQPIALTGASYILHPASRDAGTRADYLQLQPSQGNRKWASNTWYQVVLTKNLMSAGDAEFARPLAASRSCDAPNSAYCFAFHTGAADCILGSVLVMPYRYWTSVLESPIKDQNTDLKYYGLGISNQRCIAMDTSGYNWAWTSSNNNFAVTIPAEKPDISKAGALSNTVGIGLRNPTDAVNIKATASTITPRGLDSKFNVSPLTIDMSNPEVVEWWPTCQEACSNAEVGVRFNTTMSNYNLSGSSVRLYQCFDENCRSVQQINGIPVINDVNRQKLIVYSGNLEPNTYYKVSLSAASNTPGFSSSMQLWSESRGIDVVSRGKPYDKEFTWQFRTKREQCFISRVEVTPQDFIARNIFDRSAFSAQPFSAPDTCSASGQRISAWSVGWNWNSYDYNFDASGNQIDAERFEDRVASISKFHILGRNAYCTENCLLKGADIPTSTTRTFPICGNSIVEAGEDCDPPALDAGCGLNCLRTGNAVLGASPALNLYTNPSFESANHFQGWSYTTVYQPSFACSLGASVDGSCYESLAGGSYIYQTVSNLEPIKTYVGSVYASGPAVAVSGRPEAALRLVIASTDADGRKFFWNFSTNDWANAAFNGNAPVPAANQFILFNTSRSWAYYTYGVPNNKGNLTFYWGMNVGFGGVGLKLDKVSLVSNDEYGKCGNGIVEPSRGEECDKADPLTRNGCSQTCLHLGSQPAANCGNSFMGDGEDCDLGVAANLRFVTSSLGCSEKCLHMGSRLSSSWCVAHLAGFGGFVQADYAAACSKALSQCGNGVRERDEDEGCDLGDGRAAADCDAFCLKKVDAVCEGQEGCNADGKLLGSSILYSIPSICGDGEVGLGEKSECDTAANFTTTSFNSALYAPWVVAVGLGTGSVNPRAEPPEQRAEIMASTNQNSRGQTVSGQGNFVIQCGYTSDADCARFGTPGVMEYGVGADSCCYPRARLTHVYPGTTSTQNVDEFQDVCPNTAIEATFDKGIDVTTLPGNLLIASQEPVCASSTIDVSNLVAFVSSDSDYALAPWYKKIFIKIARVARRWFAPKVSADPLKWCAGEDFGTAEILDNTSTSARISVRLSKPLAPSTQYVIILKEGIKDAAGVSIGKQGANNFSWRFGTARNICAVSRVNVLPANQYFSKAGAGAILAAVALSADNQIVQAIPGFYNWGYNWAPIDNPYVEIANTDSSINNVTSSNRNGEIDVRATAIITQNAYTAARGVAAVGMSHIIVYLCENPWPPKDLMLRDRLLRRHGPYVIFPYEDRAGNNDDFDPNLGINGSFNNHSISPAQRGEYFNFSTYYCADSGVAGTFDDLPYLRPAVQTTTEQLGVLNPAIRRVSTVPAVVQTASDANALFADGNKLYVAEDQDMEIFDISSASAPTPVGAKHGALLGLKWLGKSIFVAGNNVFVAGANNFGMIIDASSTPFLTVFENRKGAASGIAVAGTKAYVIRPGKGLYVIDFSDRNNITDVLYADSATWSVLQDIYIEGRYAYVVGSTQGSGPVGLNKITLHVLDISGDEPRTVGSAEGIVERDSTATKVVVEGNYAYIIVNGRTEKLSIFNISNPRLPRVVGAYSITGLNDVAVSGRYAYLANNAGLFVVDVSAPNEPVLKNRYLAVGAKSVALAGNYAYVAAGSEVKVFDVSDFRRLAVKPFKLFLFTNKTNSDAIGLQVFPNNYHLTAREWFSSDEGYGGAGFVGDLRDITVAGYKGVTDGNNIYLDAFNMVTSTVGGEVARNLYTNIYLLSINADAKPETRKVFEQIVGNLKLNVNLTNYGYCGATEQNPDFVVPCKNDLDCPGGQTCSAEVDKLKRNYARLRDLSLIEKTLESYAMSHNGDYPPLKEGTFLAGQTVSTWPSWSLLGQGLPEDPIKKLGRAGTCTPSSTYFCVSDEQCRAATGSSTQVCSLHDATTGWSDVDRRFSFACATSSYAYRYFYSTSTGYIFRAKLERPFDGTNASTIRNWLDSFVGQFLSTPSRFIIDDNNGICTDVAEVSTLQKGYCGDGQINLSLGEQCDYNQPGGGRQIDRSLLTPANCANAAGTIGIQVCSRPSGANPGCRWTDSTMLCSALVRCGDGRKEGSEACDEGVLNGTYGHCRSDCTGRAGSCGDGVLNSPDELCDWRLHNAGPLGEMIDLVNNIKYAYNRSYSCNFDCKSYGPYCGDGTVQTAYREDCESAENCQIGNSQGKRLCTQQCKYYSPAVDWLRMDVFYPQNHATPIDDSHNAECPVACPALTSTSKFGKSFEFDGRSTYFQVDGTQHAELMFTKDFSVTMWVKRTGNSATAYPALLSKGTGAGAAGTQNNYYIGTYDTGREIYFSFYNEANGRGAGFGWNNVRSALRLKDNDWSFVAITVQSDRVNFYVDDDKTWSYRPKDINNSAYVPILGNFKDLYIGWSGNTNAGVKKVFNGLIDEVSIYNRVLSEDEILDYYHNDKGWFCSSSPAVAAAPVSPESRCGDAKVDTGEACDNGGAANGRACIPAYNRICRYCSADCNNVIEVQPTAYCGNGIIDTTTPSGAKEYCDTSPSSGLIYTSSSTLGASGAPYRNGGYQVAQCSAELNLMVNILTANPFAWPIGSERDNRLVTHKKGSKSCIDECTRLMNSCVECGNDPIVGVEVKGSVLNVLDPQARQPLYSKAQAGDNALDLYYIDRFAGKLDASSPAVDINKYLVGFFHRDNERSVANTYALKALPIPAAGTMAVATATINPDQLCSTGNGERYQMVVNNDFAHPFDFPVLAGAPENQYTMVLSPVITPARADDIRIVVKWEGPGEFPYFSAGFFSPGYFGGGGRVENGDFWGPYIATGTSYYTKTDYGGIFYHTYGFAVSTNEISYTIDTNKMANFKDTYSFYVRTNGSSMANFADTSLLKVEVYYPTNDATAAHFGRPDREFYLKNAKPSENSRASYWHVFNLKAAGINYPNVRSRVVNINEQVVNSMTGLVETLPLGEGVDGKVVTGLDQINIY